MTLFIYKNYTFSIDYDDDHQTWSCGLGFTTAHFDDLLAICQAIAEGAPFHLSQLTTSTNEQPH